MRGERGQATVEWVGIVLLVALALTALARFAPRAEDRGLGTTLAHSVTRLGRAPTAPTPQVVGIPGGKRTDSPPPERDAFMVPPLVPRPGHPGPRPSGRPPVPSFRLPKAPALLRRARRGAGLAWRRAWFACLAYERARWAVLHPESRFPGYTMPPAEVLRIANDCVSPVDFVRDWPLFRGR